MPYTLMTGATGLLGAYLLRDALLADRPMAVIVRRSRVESARQRIESLLSRFEDSLPRLLSRPVVLEGDLTQPYCGLDDAAQSWVREHCGSMLHNAASLSFYHEEKTGEPERSNVQGTQRVLELCQATGIQEFHHVSTAYVCGLRTDVCLESELDVGQEFGNDYERSKVQAEKLVRGASFLEERTFFRPAIIIGDSQTGYSSTFHGFYTPLKVASALVGGAVSPDLKGASILPALGFTPTDSKYFVPVDWVSAVMTHILGCSDLHGQTYCLAPREPVSLELTTRVIEDALERVREQANGAASGPRIDLMAGLEMFLEQMQVYRSYWRDDPRFDCSNSVAAAPHLPCPAIDYDVLMRMAMYALKHRFGWPTPPPRIPQADLAERVELRQHAANSAIRANLTVFGPGGGQWALRFNGQSVIAAECGLSDDAEVQVFGNMLDWGPGQSPSPELLHLEFDATRHTPAEVDQLASAVADWLSQGVSVGGAVTV